MTPKPEDGKTVPQPKPSYLSTGERLSHPAPGEEVVISGLAGYFPDSENTEIFMENLFSKVDMVSGDFRRWKLAHPEIPQRTGKLVNVNKFDASFFGVHYKQANTLDPMCRLLLECTYAAIIDAGVNPRSLRNTNTCIYVGGASSESEKTWFYEKMQVNGFGITGCSRAMMANRISYWLGTNGTSYALDTACSSSGYAIEHAYKSIRDGHADMAIVGGAQLCLHPYISLQFSRLGVLSNEGRCRSFDEKACGYARSEAIVVCFLQKAKDAKRIYSQILHAKTNCDGFKEQGIIHPSQSVQMDLYKNFYSECKIDPADVEFVEAHASGTRVGDLEELNAIDEIFCKNRKTPLKIGSVKSNIGHTEPASGICGVAKLCVAYHTGYMPPNLHYETPREEISALKDGRMVVVTEKQKWNNGLAAVNSFGIGGANAHILLKNLSKRKVNGGLPDDNLPRLVCVSGRTDFAVKKIITAIESKPVDAEYISLFHAVHESDISAHIYRGFTIVRPRSEERVVASEMTYFLGTRRSLWFVFSGMGSQWPGMGRELMQIPIFARAISKCDKVLKPKGLDIIKIISDPDPTIFKSILNCFVGIAAVQIGLVDILTELGIVPDNIIGHSVGELGCAYADGCFTAEQMIAAAYARGLASMETPLVKGAMAAVGLGYQDMKKLCPSDIQIACHNSADSSTISGPVDSLRKFVADLTNRGIFAKEVASANIAYHSKYIADAGPVLLKYLKEIIPDPKPRSPKWLSSSVPRHRWDEEYARYSSAEYHTNNLLSPVLFEETSQFIQHNAITIEIAPHGLLQAIMRRSLNKECTNLALTQRAHPNNVEFLLTSIGKLYAIGINSCIRKIYPKVEWPVSAETPMIAPLVEWSHNEEWFVTSYNTQERVKSGERTVRMSIYDEEMEYMSGHVIDERNLYPATGYLIIVWETLAMMMGQLYTEVPVVFKDVCFRRVTYIPNDGNLEFLVMIQKGSGKFEINEGGNSIVSGTIQAEKDLSKDYVPLVEPKDPTGDYVRSMTNKDIYKELRLRGYKYSGLFKGIESSNITGTRGKLRWSNNWVSFLDAMLQMNTLTMDSRCPYVPMRITKLSIDSEAHYAMCSGKSATIPVAVYTDLNVIRSGGVEIRGIYASAVPCKVRPNEAVMESYQFVPYFPKEEVTCSEIVRCYTQIVLENMKSIKVKAVEIHDSQTSSSSKLLMPYVMESLNDSPLIQPNCVVISNEKSLKVGPNIAVDSRKLSSDENVSLFIGTKLLRRPEGIQQAINCLNDNGFLISREELKQNLPLFHIDALVVIGAARTSTEQLVLLRKKKKIPKLSIVNINSSDAKYGWIDPLKKAIKSSERLILLSQKEEVDGVLGLTNCLRKETNSDHVGCVVIVDGKAPDFKEDAALYKEQLDKSLAINVLKNRQWGSYRHLKIKDKQTVPSEHAFVNCTAIGDLSSFRWLQGPIKIARDSQIVHVYYSALNFREVLLSAGRLALDTNATSRVDQEYIIGVEYAGRTASGARVMGMVPNKALANVLVADKNLMWPIPENWTIDEGATVPIAYSTVYYAFFVVAKLKPGSKVLIHAGTGGVGQAAINVCSYYDCEIFTTVGSPEKKAFLLKMFPHLKESHISNSRDTTFEEMIRNETNGEGVDFILNSLSDEKLQASIRCLGYRGHLLEIGQFDAINNSEVGMSIFMNECVIKGVMLDRVFGEKPELKQKLGSLIFDGVKNGCVKPICHVVFEKNEVEKAYRFMAAGKHIGKVLVRIRDEESNKTAKPTPLLIDALPRYTCDSESVYVIVGGLGDFGLELADWLYTRGARKIVLNSKKGVTNGYQSSRIRIWKSYGVQLILSTDNVTTREGCEKLLKSASSLGPVSAIFNLAVVLKDGLFENQTPESFEATFAPKAMATILLDSESRKLCNELKNFVVFSSIVSGRGNTGQTNYGMANSIVEKICEARKNAGLPALAVQWGAVGEVGLVSDEQDEFREIEIGGTSEQKIASCLQSMDIFLSQTSPIVASMIVADKKVDGLTEESISATVCRMMGINDIKTISPQSTLAELGMDSIMSVEVKQCLERDHSICMTPEAVRALTFASLFELSAKVEEEIRSAIAEKQDKEALQAISFTALLRNIADELETAEPVINMATEISNRESHGIVNKVDPRVFVIPGIEGTAAVFQALCRRIKSKVSVLQLPYDNPQETVTDIVQRLFNVVKASLYEGTPFTIVGFSYGTLIAMEIVKLLEDDGHVGTVICMDGSPDFIYTMMRTLFNNCDDETLQNALLDHMMGLIVPRDKPDISAVFDRHNWNEKLELFLQHVPEKIKHTKQYQRALAGVVYRRLKLMIDYNASHIKNLQSKCILMRPYECPDMKVSEDYGLSKYFANPVQVHKLDCNHMNIINNKDCANVINRAMFEMEEERKKIRSGIDEEDIVYLEENIVN